MYSLYNVVSGKKSHNETKYLNSSSIQYTVLQELNAMEEKLDTVSREWDTSKNEFKNITSENNQLYIGMKDEMNNIISMITQNKLQTSQYDQLHAYITSEISTLQKNLEATETNIHGLVYNDIMYALSEEKAPEDMGNDFVKNIYGKIYSTIQNTIDANNNRGENTWNTIYDCIYEAIYGVYGDVEANSLTYLIYNDINYQISNACYAHGLITNAIAGADMETDIKATIETKIDNGADKRIQNACDKEDGYIYKAIYGGNGEEYKNIYNKLLDVIDTRTTHNCTVATNNTVYSSIETFVDNRIAYACNDDEGLIITNENLSNEINKIVYGYAYNSIYGKTPTETPDTDSNSGLFTDSLKYATNEGVIYNQINNSSSSIYTLIGNIAASKINTEINNSGSSIYTSIGNIAANSVYTGINTKDSAIQKLITRIIYDSIGDIYSDIYKALYAAFVTTNPPTPPAEKPPQGENGGGSSEPEDAT